MAAQWEMGAGKCDPLEGESTRGGLWGKGLSHCRPALEKALPHSCPLRSPWSLCRKLNKPAQTQIQTCHRHHVHAHTHRHAHTHTHTHTCTCTHSHMLEPTPVHTPLLTPGSPDPPALPTAPRRRHHGLGSRLHPPQQHRFLPATGRGGGCTGQASSPRSTPGGGLHPEGGAAWPRLGPRWPALWTCVGCVSAQACTRAGGLLSALSGGVPSRAQARLRQLCWASPWGPAPRLE